MRRRPLFRRRRRGRTAGTIAAVVLLAGIGAQAALSSGSDVPASAGDAAALDDDPTPPQAPSVVPEPAPEPEPTPAVATPTPAEPSEELLALGDRLETTIASLADSLDGTDLSVVVTDRYGRTILDHRGDRLLMPASTMKAVTAATVLEVLGPDHRFATRLAATGPIEDGRVQGDLVMIGGGDPVLTTDDYRRFVYPARPATSLERLADAVAALGIERIAGRLVVDATSFGPAPYATGWPPHYIAEQDARAITALTVDAGLDVEVTEFEDGTPPEVVLTPAADPATHTAEVFAGMLADRGVALRGPPTSTLAPRHAPYDLAVVRSPPVSELLAFTMRRSDNHLADTMLRAAARAHTGAGTWSAAQRTVEDVLTELGIDTSGLRVADGSGLSRVDRVSAAQLAAVDATMTAGEHADVWTDSLAVAGESGTLRRRLVGTAGQGRFLGKTGTLDDVKAVVGHVIGAEGRRLHIAVVSNGLPAGGQWAVTVLMDTLELALVDHLDGCHREPVEDATAEGETRRVCPDAA